MKAFRKPPKTFQNSIQKAYLENLNNSLLNIIFQKLYQKAPEKLSIFFKYFTRIVSNAVVVDAFANAVSSQMLSASFMFNRNINLEPEQLTRIIIARHPSIPHRTETMSKTACSS